TLTAGDALTLAATQAVDNQGGLIAANNALNATAGSFSNIGGQIGAVNGDLSLTAGTGALTNTSGRIQAGKDVSVTSNGIGNVDGIVSGQTISLDSRGQTLDNTRGTVAARGSLDIRSGALVNDSGTVQAVGALSVDTAGQTLTNANSGSSKGILGQGAVTLRTGNLDNRTGFIGGKDAVTLMSSLIDNRSGGAISSETAVQATVGGLDNRGGQIQAQGDISLNAGSGIIDNQGSLIRSGGIASLWAGSVLNGNTLGNGLGIEGSSLSIYADQVDNRDGALRADQTLKIIGAGTVDNTRGLISSAKTLAIQDRNPGAKAQAVINSNGTLIASQQLDIDSASLTGDGKVLSEGTLSIKLTTDYTHTGQLQANGSASLETTGVLTNKSKLGAGSTLSLKAATIDNQAGAEIAAAQVRLTATDSHTLTNRGLIDGSDTFIDTITLNNVGTGRIYGDHVAIGATNLNNDVEGGQAAVIAARNRLDIGAQNLVNREHALIFSAGDMSIGGSLDGNHLATESASSLTNASATIEAQGALSIAAGTLTNSNLHISTQDVVVAVENVDEHQGLGSPYRYPHSYAYKQGVRDAFYRWVINGVGYDKSFEYIYTRTTTETQLVSSDPGQILSGGGMSITAGSFTNDKSRIIAGGLLDISANSFANNDGTGQRTVAESGTTYYYIDHQPGGSNNDWTEIRVSPYAPASIVTTIALAPAVLLGNTSPSGSGTQLSALTIGAVGQSAAGAGQAGAQVSVGAGPAGTAAVGAVGGIGASSVALTSPLPPPSAGTRIEVPAAPGGVGSTSASGPRTIIRSIVPDTTLPNNALFHVLPAGTSRYLVETDPKFANYRSWLSSDYLLQQLAIDPAAIQKRLGDGFYEQKLVREQIAQLTGRRFVDGYASDEAQFRGLLEAGATVAKAWKLKPGVALSAAQMAQLTSDIVWLVEKDVVLPDGSHTRALVPQVYVRVREGDLDGSGALLAGANVNVDVKQSLVNSGAIAGRNIVTLAADNLRNLGGRITGDDVTLAARTDLDNLGGRIAADSSLLVTASRDINITTTTRSTAAEGSDRTYIDRVAGLYVIAPGGLLTALAGRDLTLTAAEVRNDGKGGQTHLAAGNNLTLATVTERQRIDSVIDSRNYQKQTNLQEVGSTVSAAGNISLDAGTDLAARAAAIASDKGAVTLSAGRDIALTAGEQRVVMDAAGYVKDKSTFSTRTRTTRIGLDDTTTLGTTVSGEKVAIASGQDILVRGSSVVSTSGTVLAAGRDLTLEAAREHREESRFDEQKKSGLMSSGGVGFTIGSRQMSTDTQTTADTAAASTVGATNGSVVLTAGRDYRQVGSDVLSPNGDIAIVGQRVSIEEARETSRSVTQTKSKQSGLTVAITSPVISAIQTAQQMQRASKDTSDPRMKALAVANVGFAANNAVGAIQAGQGGSAAQQAGGVNISVSVGSSKSQSTSTQQSDTAAGSSVTAGGNLTIVATGAGKDSNLTVQGSSLKAGNDLTLAADNRVDLLAASNTSTMRSTNSSSSASVGFSYGTDGFLVNVGASRGKGKANGDDLTWTNTRADAGNTLTIQSGGDTTLKGAVATGNRVVADIGGNLTIESLQDKSTYDSKQQNLGVSVSVGIGKMGGSVSASQSKIKSNYQSVGEQSALRAGDGGFRVAVAGDTDLKAGAITSTQAAIDAGKNRFTTGGRLTLSDLENKAEYSAQSVGVSASFGSSVNPDKPQQSQPASVGMGAGFGQKSGSASSTTRAAISGVDGDTRARTGDAETGIGKIFDAAKVQRDIDAQVQITQAFGREAPKAVATFAQNQAADLRKQASQESQPERRAELEAEAKKWDEGGAYRVAMHTAVGGLAGGVSGALGAGATAAAAPLLDQLQDGVQAALKSAGAGDTVAKAASQLVAGAAAAGIGAVAGGGNLAGTAMGFNIDANNRQLHIQEKKLISNLAKDRAKQICRGDSICETRATVYWTDMLEQVAKGWVDDKEDAKNQQYLSTVLATTQNPASQGALGGVQQYLTDTIAAQNMLAPYVGKTITVNGATAVSYGTPQSYFSATEAQRADPYVNAFLGQIPGPIIPGQDIRNEDRLERFNVQNGSAQPVYPIEEVALGGAVGDRALTLVKSGWRLLEVRGAGEVAASAGGNISAGKVTVAAMDATLNATERTTLAGLDKLPTTALQGDAREFVMNSYFSRNGFQSLEGKCGSNCFDGVFIKGDKVYVVETKPLNSDGSISLAGPSKSTPLQTQMSDPWIAYSVNRLENSGNAELIRTAEVIKAARESGNLVKVVTGVNTNGMTILRLR
ncbi:MAG: hemagglutinin repeat-containing protein, partial [Actinomycetota bacterium]